MNKDIKYFSQYSPYTPICEILNINFENLILKSKHAHFIYKMSTL